MTQPDFAALLRELAPVPMPRLMTRAAGRVLAFDRAARLHRELTAPGDDGPLPARLLERLEVRCRVSDRDLECIPLRGPAVVVVNHPFGLLDGAVLASILRNRRSDVKLLANRMLSMISELDDLLIPVDTLGAPDAAGINRRAVRQALDWLTGGGLLGVFPAGEVAHFDWKARTVKDPVWKPAVARVIALAGRRVRNLSIVPAHITGSNSLLFQAAGMLHPRLRTALLVRELLNKRGSEIEVRIGQPVALDSLFAIPSDEERIEYLRWRADLLAHRARFRPATRLPLRVQRGPARAPQPLVQAAPSERWTEEVARLAPLLQSGEFEVYLAGAGEIPAVLEEIGRLRELTFREVGEGTGNQRDLDAFDAHYLHLFVWHPGKCEVVGAYRLGPADVILERHGTRGLYTATLFRYGREFLERLGPALELGRSFVRPEYQKAFAPLLLLWKGIGRYVARNPQYKILFGPVSISNEYQSLSRQIMVSFLERHASLRDWAALVSSRNPFRPRRSPAPQPVCSGLDIEHVSAAVADLEPAHSGVPVLLRQYLKLGGKLLGFNVDPEFAGALDGLILVDLTKTAPKLVERYLGKSEAASFFAFHGGAHEVNETADVCELGATRHRSGNPAPDAVLQIHRRG